MTVVAVQSAGPYLNTLLGTDGYDEAGVGLVLLIHRSWIKIAWTGKRVRRTDPIQCTIEAIDPLAYLVHHRGLSVESEIQSVAPVRALNHHLIESDMLHGLSRTDCDSVCAYL